MHISKKTLVIIVFVILAISLVGVVFSVGGFTGTTATFDRAEIAGTTAGPYTPTSDTTFSLDVDGDIPIIDDCTGISAQISGQPQTVATEQKPDIKVDNADGTYDLYKWEVRELEFHVDFQSRPVGTLSPTGLEFFIELKNNYDSVWWDAECLGYTFAAWVEEYEVKQDGLFHSILPSAQGTFFQLYSVDDGHAVSPPQSFSTALNLDTLRQFQSVEIKFTVDNFRPSTGFGWREEAHVFINVHLNVLVLGHWDHLVHQHTQGPAPDEGFNFWADLGKFFTDFLLEILLIIAVVAVVIVIIIKAV
jgi:hypothetical protein